MPWEVIANLKGLPGDAASLAELANRPKSTTPALAAGTNLNTMHQQQHVGWWSFSVANVTNAPAGMGSSASMIEVLAPSEWSAVQRIHDRATRTTYERSVISPTANTWSAWRAFAMSDEVMAIRGTIGSAEVTGNLQNYKDTEHLGLWTLWAPFVANTPKDAIGRCTLEVVRAASNSLVQRLTERDSGRTWTTTYDSSTGWEPWIELTHPLTQFHRALRKSKTRNVNVVVVGDSNGEGVNVTAGITERWINKLQAALNRAAGNWEGAKFPFIPAGYGLSAATPGQPSVLEGNTVTGGYNWGFGWRTATLRDATSKATFTFTGTKATVMYTEGANAGIMDIKVDDAAAVVVDTSSTGTNASRLWETGELASGTHTIEVTLNAASAADKYVYLEGILTWNSDDATRGVRVIDASRSGRRMDDITSERANYLCRAMTQMGNVELVIVPLGTNDCRAGISLGDYRAAAERLVSMMRTYNLNIPVVFVLPFVGADHTRAQLSGYGGVLGNTASNIQGVHFVDMSLRMPQIPTDLNSPASQGLYSDLLHMTDQGHTIYAGHMYEAIMGR